MAAHHKLDRIAYGVAFAEQASFKDTYGGPSGWVFLESYLLKPRGTESDTVVVFMHPVGGGAYLPFVTQLARAGHHVIYCNSRYRGNDSALIMEKVVLDLGACIRDAKERLGYTNVVLAGWSGGGSLSLYYQEQAEKPSVTESPAGDPIDLTAAGLMPADAVVLVAAHPSRHRVLTDSLDASITDESRPFDRDPSLDLYGGSVEAPYSAEFVAAYRDAQVARNRRITAWVKEQLAALKAAGRPNEERAFVVNGTLADPRWIDPAVDPNDRTPGTCFLGEPSVVNDGPVGLARFSTLRSWLSQWSYDDANGDGVRAAASVSKPALVIWNSADDICIPQHASDMYEAIPHDDKEIHSISGATHYYMGPDDGPKLAEAIALCSSWLARHGFEPAPFPEA